MTNQTSDAASVENDVYERLGTLVRSLHDALRELGAEQVLVEAASEFPSARERLIHIAQLTEKAANTVLGKVEETSPIQDRLAQAAPALHQAWVQAVDAAQVPEALQPLANRTASFLREAGEGATTTRAALSDMMMAQDFQDLTGQLIKKVVSVLERTENDLLRLLVEAAPPGAVSPIKKEEIMAGPGAPGSVALDQGSVDDLLADLGF